MAEDTILRNYDIVRGDSESHAQIWAVGGGKGGVGKSFISTSLAIFLANMGRSTIIIDLDLGAANLHTYLGESSPKKTLQDVIDDGSYDLSRILIQSKIPNLKFITGNNDSLEVANIGLEQKSQLMSAIYKLKADFIILDLSAGTHSTTMDFFNMAQNNMVVTTPEPVAIENAYRFIKAAFFQKLKRYEQQLGIGDLVADLMTRKEDLGIKSPADLLHFILKTDPVNGEKLLTVLKDYEFSFILNQTRTYNDTNLGHSIQSVTKKYFGIPAKYLGNVDHDNAVWQSLRKQRHLLVEYPHSRLYAQLLGITRDLANQPRIKKAV